MFGYRGGGSGFSGFCTLANRGILNVACLFFARNLMKTEDTEDRGSWGVMGFGFCGNMGSSSFRGGQFKFQGGATFPRVCKTPDFP